MKGYLNSADSLVWRFTLVREGVGIASAKGRSDVELYLVFLIDLRNETVREVLVKEVIDDLLFFISETRGIAVDDITQCPFWNLMKDGLLLLLGLLRLLLRL